MFKKCKKYIKTLEKLCSKKKLAVYDKKKLAVWSISVRFFYVQSWTSPGGNTPQDTNCTATWPPSRKLFKLDEPDMQDTAGEGGTNS